MSWPVRFSDPPAAAEHPFSGRGRNTSWSPGRAARTPCDRRGVARRMLIRAWPRTPGSRDDRQSIRSDAMTTASPPRPAPGRARPDGCAG
jgi:hypothetical protein